MKEFTNREGGGVSNQGGSSPDTLHAWLRYR